MQAFQRKFRVFAVVESQLHPADGTVALIALSAVTTTMLVVVFVTGKTGRPLRIILEISAVAGITAHLAVFAFEWEIGFVVIEFCLFPISRSVARLAFITAAAQVDVVEAVTGNAGGRRVLIALIDVTKIAPDLFVFPT